MNLDITIDQAFLEEIAAYFSAFFEKEAEEMDHRSLCANAGYIFAKLRKIMKFSRYRSTLHLIPSLPSAILETQKIYFEALLLGPVKVNLSLKLKDVEASQGYKKKKNGVICLPN